MHCLSLVSSTIGRTQIRYSGTLAVVSNQEPVCGV
jgi:hypothetical protein